MATQIITRQTLAFRINGQSANNRIVVIPPHAVVGSFGDVSFTRDYTDTDVAQYFYPPLPIDFGQFGVAWAVQAYNALANKYNLATVSTENALMVGVYYVADGNNSSHAKVNNAMLLVNIPIVQHIQTNFDTNFDNLVNSITGLSNLFNTVFNTQNLALQAITTALNNLQINIGDVDIAGVDDIVTQLQNLYTINASQNANLSQLSQLANIVTAITNKDNQSDIRDELRYIFTQSVSNNSYRQIGGVNNLSVFKGYNTNTELSNVSALARSNLRMCLSNISNKLSSVNDSYNNSTSTDNSRKLLYNIDKILRALCSSDESITNFDITEIVNTSYLKSISDKLQNIETKLEENLPFANLIQNEIVTDYTQVMKGNNK